MARQTKGVVERDHNEARNGLNKCSELMIEYFKGKMADNEGPVQERTGSIRAVNNCQKTHLYNLYICSFG